jgi:uncharacterized protein YkwD
MVRAREVIAYFSHTRPDGRGCSTAYEDLGGKYTGRYRGLGENIGLGPVTPDIIVASWMNSPGHRANILDPDYTHIGVGVAMAELGSTIGWVQMFYG